MPRSKTAVFLLAALLVALSGAFTSEASAAATADWPNPFGWFKRKKMPKPTPPPKPAPPSPRDPRPPAPRPRPAKPPLPRDGGTAATPATVAPTPSSHPAPPSPATGGTGDPKTPGVEPKPPAPAHVHAWSTVAEVRDEPARYEKVQVGVDANGTPKFETQLVAPARKVTTRFDRCACGAKNARD